MGWKLTLMSKTIFEADFLLACCLDGGLSIHFPAPVQENLDWHHSSSQVWRQQHPGREVLSVKPARWLVAPKANEVTIGALMWKMKKFGISLPFPKQRNCKKILSGFLITAYWSETVFSQFSLLISIKHLEIQRKPVKIFLNKTNKTDKLNIQWIGVWENGMVIEGQRSGELQNQEGTIMPSIFNFQFYFLKMTRWKNF